MATLSPLALGNVRRDTCIAEDLLFFVPNGESTIPNMPDSSIGQNNTVLFVERLSSFLYFELSHHNLPVLFVNGIEERPRVFVKALRRTSPNTLKTWANIESLPSFNISHPKDLIDCFRNQSESFFTLPERLLSLLPRRDFSLQFRSPYLDPLFQGSVRFTELLFRLRSPSVFLRLRKGSPDGGYKPLLEVVFQDIILCPLSEDLYGTIFTDSTGYQDKRGIGAPSSCLRKGQGAVVCGQVIVGEDKIG